MDAYATGETWETGALLDFSRYLEMTTADRRIVADNGVVVDEDLGGHVSTGVAGI